MVLALLAGRKTMTRRLAWRTVRGDDAESFPSPWQRVKPGDRLWVRESLFKHDFEGWRYSADKKAVSLHKDHPSVPAMIAWAHHKEGWSAPSIHMPRWASRIALVVTATKIEPLQKISECDAKAEGAMFHDGHGIGHSGWRHDYRDVHANARSSFARLWDDLHGKGSWKENPELVALTFTVHKQNIDSMKEAA